MRSKVIISVGMLVCLMVVSQTTFAAIRAPKEIIRECSTNEVFAKNITTRETKKFKTSCDIPEGWVVMGQGQIIDEVANKKKADEGSVQTIISFTIPTSKNVGRKMFVLSKDYEIALSNSTIPVGVGPEIKKGKYSLLPVNSDSQGELFLVITHSKNSETDKVQIAVKDGNDVKILTIPVRQGNYISGEYIWNILK